MKRLICRLSALILMLALLATSASALTVDEALTLLDESYLLELPEQVTQAESLDALFSLAYKIACHILTTSSPLLKLTSKFLVLATKYNMPRTITETL